LGPDVGLNVYDYFVSTNDSSPVLISNAGFVQVSLALGLPQPALYTSKLIMHFLSCACVRAYQYFMTFNTVNMSQLLWNYPSMCGL
jgi:hypothetical protein